MVAHGGVIGEVLAQASGARPWAFIGADNASISHVVVTDDRWAVRRFNDTTHLDDRLTVEAAPDLTCPADQGVDTPAGNVTTVAPDGTANAEAGGESQNSWSARSWYRSRTFPDASTFASTPLEVTQYVAVSPLRLQLAHVEGWPAIVVSVKLRETPVTRATIADRQALNTVSAVDP